MFRQPEDRIKLYEGHGNLLNTVMVKDRNIQVPKGFSGNEKTEDTAATHEDSILSVAKEQNRKAFIALYEHFAPRIKSFMMKSGVITPDTAEELAQETMLTVWKQAGSFNPEKARASTWIFTIARNKKIDYLRKNRRALPDKEEIAFDTGAESIDSGDMLNQAEEASIIEDALAGLPEEQAALIKKAFFEDKTHNDIASEENIPLGTVKSRIRLGLERLRHKLGDKLS